MAELRKAESEQAQALQTATAEKELWFDQKMAALTKRAQEVKEMETTVAQPKAGTKPELSLLEVVGSLGKATEKARRDMSNLVAGKNRPEQAFAKWESNYCKLSLEFVNLVKQAEKDKETYRQQHTEQLANLVLREEKIKYLEDFNDYAATSRDKSIEKKAQAFKEEQEEWRLQRAMSLKGKERKVVEQKWKMIHEQSFRARIWDEAKGANMDAARQEIEAPFKALCQTKYDSGKSAGRIEGFQQGWTDALNDLETQLDAAHTNGYEEAVKSQAAEDAETARVSYENGQRQGHQAGAAESKTAVEVAYSKGIHCGIQTADSEDPPERLRADGSAKVKHSYWLGREVALSINPLNAFSDPTSKWFRAEEKGSEKWHLLSVREHKADDRTSPSYHEGLFDGLFRSNKDNIPIPGWRPALAFGEK